MSLENITSGAASTIASLDPNSPGSGEGLAQADDHLRNCKKAPQLTFPNISATVSGVAAELAFAHKGGTVSGNVMVRGNLSVSGSAFFGGDIFAREISTSATMVVDYALSAGYATSASEAYRLNGGLYHFIKVDESGTAVVNPSAWDVYHESTGVYRVSHGAGTVYPFITTISTNSFLVIRVDVAVGEFTYRLSYNSGTPANVMVSIIGAAP